jgi:hypothetical protein
MTEYEELVEGPKAALVESPAARGETLPGGVPEEPGPIGREGALLPGQQTWEQFLRAAAGEVLTRLGVPHGDQRAAAEVAVAGMLEGMLDQYAAGQETLLNAAKRIAGLPAEMTPTLEQLQSGLVNALDPERAAAVEAGVAALSDEETELRFFEDYSFDQAPFMAAAAALPMLPPRLTFAAGVAAAPVPGSIPSDMNIGKLVHLRVQEDYRLSHPRNLVVAERAVYQASARTTIGRLAKGGDRRFAVLEFALGTALRSRLRPDIIDFTLGEIYEIKPRRQAALGVVQLAGYVAAYNAAIGSLGLPPLREGTSWIPLRTYPVPPDKVAVTFMVPGLPGLILYDVFRLPESRLPFEAAVEVVVIALAAALLLAAVLDPVPGDEVAAGAILARLLARSAGGLGRSTGGLGRSVRFAY